MTDPRAAPGLLRIDLAAHLTRAVLAAALRPLTLELGRSAATPHRLLVVCLSMTGYDADARALFVQWNRRYAGRIERVGIVTQNRLWHMVITAMSLASRQNMRAFDPLPDAEAWLGERRAMPHESGLG